MQRWSTAMASPDTAAGPHAYLDKALRHIARLRATMNQRKWRTCLICSEPYNLLRLMKTARALGIEAYASPALESPEYTSAFWRWLFTAQAAENQSMHDANVIQWVGRTLFPGSTDIPVQ